MKPTICVSFESFFSEAGGSVRKCRLHNSCNEKQLKGMRICRSLGSRRANCRHIVKLRGIMRPHDFRPQPSSGGTCRTYHHASDKNFSQSLSRRSSACQRGSLAVQHSLNFIHYCLNFAGLFAPALTTSGFAVDQLAGFNDGDFKVSGSSFIF
mmetsp:Transcript_16461/g.29147  ORF Transcript_16461/g.29147 Transcript_16461/m.29147 type:complete len:153 (-) Transcript_16461:132-590(-)